MVVFTCNHCGESLQKPKVEKHYAFVCRTIKSLTCVDCFKDFRGEEYTSHTKCLTEDERYAAKGTYVNGIVKKGEVKQESWVEMIKSILDKEGNMKPSSRALLSSISYYTNIPRKKNKFLNFIRSSSGGRVNMKDVEEVWNIIEQYKNNQLKNKEQTNGNKISDNSEQIEVDTNVNETKDSKNKTNETRKRKQATVEENKEDEQDSDVPKKKKKCKKTEEFTSEKKEEQLEEENKKIRFQDIILEILSKKGSIPLKKLQKKVVNAYLKETGETEVTPKIIKKFNKKLNKLAGVEVNDGVVVLKTNE